MLFQEACVSAKRFGIKLLELCSAMWRYFVPTARSCDADQRWAREMERWGKPAAWWQPVAAVPCHGQEFCGNCRCFKQSEWGLSIFLKPQSVNYSEKKWILSIETFYFSNLNIYFNFTLTFKTLFCTNQTSILSRQHFAAIKALYSKCQIVFSHWSSFIFLNFLKKTPDKFLF